MEEQLSFQNIFWFLLLVFAFILVVTFLRVFIASFTVAVFLYYSSRPLYSRLEKHIPQSVAALVTIGFTYIPLFILSVYIVQLGYTEAQSFLIERDLYIGNFINQTDISILQSIAFFDSPQDFMDSQDGFEIAQQLLDSVLVLSSVAGGVFFQVIVTTVSIYALLIYDSDLRTWANSNFSHLSKHWDVFWDRVDKDLYIVYFGNILNGIFATIIAIIIAVAYSAVAPSEISIGFPILFGILSGIASLIPVIGLKLTYVPITIYLSAISFQSPDTFSLLIYVLGFLLVCAVFLDFLLDMVIRPYVSGKNINISLLLITYIGGVAIFGWYGFFLAPVFLVLFHHFAKLILPEIMDAWSS